MRFSFYFRFKVFKIFFFFFNLFSFLKFWIDRQHCPLYGNIQHQQNGTLPLTWANWCEIQLIRLDGQPVVLNFGHNAHSVHQRCYSWAKKIPEACQAIRKTKDGKKKTECGKKQNQNQNGQTNRQMNNNYDGCPTSSTSYNEC